MQQQQDNYFDYVFQIVGENLKPNPQRLFETPQVYLFIDKPLKIIWIWAGTKSRLFHRYIAANWAGKLKGRKDFRFKFTGGKILQMAPSGAFFVYDIFFVP